MTDPTEAAYVAGWPDNVAFRSWLGLDPADTRDEDATDQALAAAKAEALELGVDPEDGPADEYRRQSLFVIARQHLNARSQPEQWQPGSPGAYERRHHRRVLAGPNMGAV